VVLRVRTRYTGNEDRAGIARIKSCERPRRSDRHDPGSERKSADTNRRRGLRYVNPSNNTCAATCSRGTRGDERQMAMRRHSDLRVSAGIQSYLRMYAWAVVFTCSRIVNAAKRRIRALIQIHDE